MLRPACGSPTPRHGPRLVNGRDLSGEMGQYPRPLVYDTTAGSRGPDRRAPRVVRVAPVGYIPRTAWALASLQIGSELVYLNIC